MTKASIQSITNWMEQPTDSPLLISGPCSVETPEQVLATARQLKAQTPISLLRGGVWKPRTKPGSFEGVGAEAMQWLIDAGRAINTPVTTEVANAQHVEIALKAGVDVLWIGARTTVNPFSVQEIVNSGFIPLFIITCSPWQIVLSGPKFVVVIKLPPLMKTAES